MPRGRPKGSTGVYFRWPPERIVELFQDADLLASKKGRINKRDLAKRLKEKFRDKYQYDSLDQMRRQLSKRYQNNRPSDDIDAFNEAVLARLLGETK
jgi:hypothetical protein